MKRMLSLLGGALALTGVIALWPADRAQATDALVPGGTMPLPNVSGRIDHLGYDAARQQLFVAALENDTVEVLDVARNRHVRTLSGFREPQGVAVVPDLNVVAIANGETGTLQAIDTQSFAVRWTATIGGDADNVRYDAAAGRLYVAAEGGLFVVDPGSGHVVGRIAINGHPESFQLASDGAVYANLPGLISAQIVAANRRSMNVAGKWSPGCSGNYPMALDEQTARLFVGCRRPARLSTVDTRSGRAVGSIDVVGDTDDLFYDAARQRLYVIGGEGFVDVLRREGDALTRLGRVATRGGARTGLWVAALNKLFVAVPARSGEGAEIRVFAAKP